MPEHAFVDHVEPMKTAALTGESPAPWGIHRSAAPDAAWHEAHRRRRAKTPPLVNYTLTLIGASKRLRQRSMPPPPPPPYAEPSIPRKPFRPQ